MSPIWKPYVDLRPDQLADLVSAHPVAFWPLGLIEHHGYHLPIGYDGLKASRICERIAAKTGGVILPVMWWGGGGGHDIFRWSHYQDEASTATILVDTINQLVHFGIRSIVLLAGHYPWQSLLEKHIPSLLEQHPAVQIHWGSEITICGDALQLAGDHAAYEETSLGLALFPELIDLEALTAGRDNSVWPNNQPPPKEQQHPAVCFDPANPLFAQMGKDSRHASAPHGEANLTALVDYLSQAINQYLNQME